MGRGWEGPVWSKEKEEHRGEVNRGSSCWAAVMTSGAALCLDHRGNGLSQDRPSGSCSDLGAPSGCPMRQAWGQTRRTSRGLMGGAFLRPHSRSNLVPLLVLSELCRGPHADEKDPR